MLTKSLNSIEEMWNALNEDEKTSVVNFTKELLKSKKYKKLREEIQKRKEEIDKGEILSHKEIWNDI